MSFFEVCRLSCIGKKEKRKQKEKDEIDYLLLFLSSLSPIKPKKNIGSLQVVQRKTLPDLSQNGKFSMKGLMLLEIFVFYEV